MIRRIASPACLSRPAAAPDPRAAALQRGQDKGNLRADVDCAQAALFMIALYEGSIGLGKAYQSKELYKACAAQLKTYLEALRA